MNNENECANCGFYIEHDVVLCDECYEDAKSLRAQNGLSYYKTKSTVGGGE